MSNCKYQSFTNLSKINDPELLLASFTKNAAPEHQDNISFFIFEQKNKKWSLLSSSEPDYITPSKRHLDNLTKYHADNNAHDYFVYNKKDGAWYCAHYELMHSNYALIISAPSKEILVDTAYLQQLFHFYCHQLNILYGTYHDALTGLLNRRSLNKKLSQLIDQQHNRHRKTADHPSFYVMLDIDYFKNINDTFGHLYGDEVLLQLGQLMEDSFRDNDLLFRYGGEEFAVILMNITKDEAMKVLERFRNNVANHNFPKIEQVTISVGFTDFSTELTIDETIARADAALYYCKQHGRNKTSYYQQLIDENKLDNVVVTTESA